jgi:hypothetical protein
MPTDLKKQTYQLTVTHKEAWVILRALAIYNDSAEKDESDKGYPDWLAQRLLKLVEAQA